MERLSLGCPCFINSRSDWFPIVTYKPKHACCPVLENKRFCTGRICEKYEYYQANPTWNTRALQGTVQEAMVVDVSMGMVSRAKASVVKKVMDSLTDEYSRFYDYALEPKRSNPRSSVHVVLDPEEVDRVFKEFTPACWCACVSGYFNGNYMLSDSQGGNWISSTSTVRSTDGLGPLLCTLLSATRYIWGSAFASSH